MSGPPNTGKEERGGKLILSSLQESLAWVLLRIDDTDIAIKLSGLHPKLGPSQQALQLTSVHESLTPALGRSALWVDLLIACPLSEEHLVRGV